LIGAIVAIFYYLNKPEEYTYYQFITDLEAGKDVDGKYGDIVGAEFDMNSYEMKVQFKDAEGKTKKLTCQFTGIEVEHFFFNSGDGISDQSKIANKWTPESGLFNPENIKTIPVKETPWIVQYLPFIILIGIVILFMVFSMRQANGGKMGSFGKSKARNIDKDKRVTFADVAGADEEKEELTECVEYLKNPSKFTHLGAKIPHGVLLVGPPGTGKTLLAKAVAGEAGVPFYSMSGSDFVEMYVGVGASRVRDLFDNARKSPAAIIFIDEIDAVGRQRGAGLGGGHDEREQTLNQLLVEMDGFDGHSGIIVMAATNRPDILDSALLRPGRFDRQITVGYPDITGREAILKVHSKDKPLEESVDLHKVAQTTVGFTGADLANLLNEAALLAARRGKSLIGMAEIEDSMIKVTVGTQKKAKRMSDKERRNTACHEAGHAILSHILPTQDPVRQISIIPSGRALGYTLTPPVEDKYSESKQEMKERIAMMLGGRVAEQMFFGDYTGGASNDIMRATQVARKMVTVYGMSDELGTIHFGSDHSSDAVFLGRDFSSTPTYSEQTAAKIDAEIKKIIDEAYRLAWDTLTEYREKLDFITEFLLRNEIMDDEQFELAMKEGVTMEEVEALVTEKKRRSEEENKRRQAEIDEKKRQEEQTRRELEKALGISDDEEENTPEIEAPQNDENSENANTSIDETEK
jgi:cell division protease FtsH